MIFLCHTEFSFLKLEKIQNDYDICKKSEIGSIRHSDLILSQRIAPKLDL